MDFFENYAIVAMQSDNITFYACKIIKGTSGFNLKKTNFLFRHFFLPFFSFLKFSKKMVLGPILAQQTTKFELSD